MSFFGLEVRSKSILNILLYAVMIYFIYLMMLITVQYIPVNTDVAFLRIKQDVIQYSGYQLAFFTHVYTSIFVLIIGLFQLSAYVRIKYPATHRTLGKTYILLILFFSGPTGLVMGYYANGGWIAQFAFCLLAVLWMIFTFKAFVYAKKRKWELHRNFMYRSYALTLSAISLRLFKWMIASLFDLPPMDTYQIVAWAGWVVNLAIVEVIIHKRR